MNSYLQSLFHLPSFRNMILAMDIEDVRLRANSIPWQLQCLFSRMEQVNPAGDLSALEPIGTQSFVLCSIAFNR